MILCAFLLGVFGAVFSIGPAFALAGAVIVVKCWLADKRQALSMAVLVSVAATGWVLIWLDLETVTYWKELESIHKQQAFQIHGTVLSRTHTTGYRTTYSLRADTICGDGWAAKDPGKVILRVHDRQGITQVFSPGTGLLIQSPEIQQVLTGMEDPAYLRSWHRNGFKAVLQVSSDDVAEIKLRHTLRKTAYVIRQKSEAVIGALLPEDENRLLKSLFFGQRQYLDGDTLDVFSRTGTAHITAVSGLHTGILAMTVQWVLVFLGLVNRHARLAAVLLVWFYAAMAGFPVSVVRAASMVTIYALSFPLGRRYDAKSSLLWCALLFLALTPSSLWSVSFQLSFAATAAILWVFPLLNRMELGNGLWFPGKELLWITTAVQVGVWPILAWHFGSVSLISILVNPLIIPILGILLPAAMAMVVVGTISIQAAVPLSLIVQGGLRCLWLIPRWFAKWPMAAISIETIHPMWVVGYYGILIYCVWRAERRKSTCKELIPTPREEKKEASDNE